MSVDNDMAGGRDRSRPINARWLAGPARALGDRFAALDGVDAIVAQAQALLGEAGWTERLFEPLIAALADDPWFEPPFRASRDPLRTGLVLLDSDKVSIIASVTGAAALARLPLPATLIVPGRIAVTRYVRGGMARMRRWRTAALAPDFSATDAAPCVELPTTMLSDGQVMLHDGRTDGHLIVAADGDVVAITVTVKQGAAPLMREYRVADGGFVRAASADEAASRMEMLLTLLRVSGRADAGARFDAASHHPAFHLRWAAMREWLMLDARGARDRLAAMGRGDANAEVRAAAAATLGALDRRLAQEARPACPA